jgi:hypothetical protein
MADTGGEVTGLLAELRYARKDSLGRVMPSACRELRRIPDERVDQPLGPADRSPAWQTRASMYRPAVDRERRRLAAKPGVAAALPELADGKLLALGQLNTRQTRLVELRCFEWPWVRETAEVWDIAIRTVKPAGTPAAEWMGAGRRP